MSGHGEAPDLSVILPCYRAGALAAASVERLGAWLRGWPGGAEVIVVDDGGGDVQANLSSASVAVRVLSHPVNRGKGAAVRTGMVAARGRVRVYTDVDLPYDLELLNVMHELISSSGAHLVMGDRTLSLSEYHERQPALRRMASALCSQFVGSLVTGGFFDTQCGLKAMRGDVADAVFPLLRVDRFAFDVELVYVALKHRLDLRRIPVRLVSNETSSVRVVRDSVRAVRDVLGIKWNQVRHAYQSPVLSRIIESDFLELRDRTRRRTPGTIHERSA